MTPRVRPLARAEPGIAVDVPNSNPDAVALARELAFEPSFETARMDRGPDPGLPLWRIFGVTSLELG